MVPGQFLQQVKQCHQNAIKDGHFATFAVPSDSTLKFKSIQDFSPDKTPFQCQTLERKSQTIRIAGEKSICPKREIENERKKFVTRSIVSALNATLLFVSVVVHPLLLHRLQQEV